ncbi:hypothetical protein MOQ72_00675 [Saccharopolyspora sp. K220]|uniref:hypothetical protein n=1 Tax=Saccharopolyspora soli TaxID=2926618 RepID=UPI001F57B906|nr:hypothetical protein [Saccharopolyspora soli]MCI2415924.1 hypothetical protein [Saccharopolyspora soli]
MRTTSRAMVGLALAAPLALGIGGVASAATTDLAAMPAMQANHSGSHDAHHHSHARPSNGSVDGGPRGHGSNYSGSHGDSGVNGAVGGDTTH